MNSKPLIVVDSREHAHAITKILEHFRKRGIDHIISKLPYGDYMSYDNPRLVIDRKQSLMEVCSNVVQQHDRFMREIHGANSHGIRIVFLVEHSSHIKSLDDVMFWQNPRLKQSPMAVSGERLYKILTTISARNDVDFLFCSKQHTGEMIEKILLGGYENG